MANPAELLHAQLLAWSNSPNESVRRKRGLDDKDAAPEIWKQHRIAVQRLNDVEEALKFAEDQGTNVRVFEQFIPMWTEAIFAFPNGWTSTQSAAVLKTPMDQLASAAAVLSTVVPSFKEGSGQQGFDEFLITLAHNVQALGDEHEFLKQHALRVIRHLKGCLDDVEIFGEFRLVNALAELQTILDALNEAANGKNSFFDKAKSGAWSFFTKSSILALVSAQVIATGALTAGGEDFYERVVKPELPAAIEAVKSIGLAPKALPPAPGPDDVQPESEQQ